MTPNDANGEKTEERPLVLVVDDDHHVVALTRAYLERDGYRVLEASDEIRGLELARTERSCLVVLDLSGWCWGSPWCWPWPSAWWGS